MTKTTNYQLPKWEKTDRIQMKDFNDMTATLDTALKANADTAAAASAAVALCGNCAIYQTTYTGGDMTTPTITCPGKPMVLMVCESDGAPALIAWRGMPTTSTSSSSYEYTITWGERTVSWLLGKNHDGNMNWSGKQYHALVLLGMSAE